MLATNEHMQAMSIDKRRIAAEPTEVYEDVPLDESRRVIHTYAGGIGVILKSLEGDILEYAAHLQYQTTNNEAEYEALLKGLELAKSLGEKSIIVKGDFQLVINQVNGMCDAKEDRMKKYLSKVRQLVQKFTEVSFVQLPREENMETDALAKAASGGEATDAYGII
ncbi:uncharacterized protein LOC142632870 [Castanea sativa]|uniref:uncharacterized protein LOC142632870 n=1 Tax=Castanea sativa TaxID=21020 RepID=UPI003F654014